MRLFVRLELTLRTVLVTVREALALVLEQPAPELVVVPVSSHSTGHRRRSWSARWR